jgi:hypothetical protein
MVFWIVKRPEERNALNVIEMEMAEEYVSTDRLITELLLEFLAEVADPRAPVENQQLIGIGPDLDTRRISAISHVFFLRCRRRAPYTPETHTHEPSPPRERGV